MSEKELTETGYEMPSDVGDILREHREMRQVLTDLLWHVRLGNLPQSCRYLLTSTLERIPKR